MISSAQRRLLQLFFAGTRREGPREALQRVLRLMNQRKHLFSPQEAPVFRRRIGPELNDLHIFRLIFFIYLLLQMPSRSPKGGAPARVACRKARPRALATPPDRFLPLAEARGRQIAYGGRKSAARGPVVGVWTDLEGFGSRYAHLDAPNSRRQSFGVGIWPLKRRSRPRCPTRPAAQIGAEAATRAR